MTYSERESLPVSYLRQLAFCPRIPWFLQNLPQDLPKPLWVKQGEAYQQRREQLLGKRPLFRDAAQCHYRQKFNVAVQEPTLGIHGVIDIVIETERESIPVEIKLNVAKPQRGQVLQLVAYALCLESGGAHVHRGLIIAGKRQRRYEVHITDALRDECRRAIARLHELIANPYLPPSSATLSKCMQCEFQNFCQDRDL